MQRIEVAMTKPIVCRRSGKIDGIRGLYKSPVTGRFYVRYSYHGVDKQKTIFPKKVTFSELERVASSALIKLKKEVKAEFETITISNDEVHLGLVELGAKNLQEAVEKEWSLRGVTEAHITKLLKLSSGLALYSGHKKNERERINEHNISLLTSRLAEAETQGKKRTIFDFVGIVFSQLIKSGKHTGCDPTHFVPKPKYVRSARKGELTLDVIEKVYKRLLEKAKDHDMYFEYALFFRLCVETGQRPVDVFRFDVRNLSNDHYLFWNNKTSRFQRVEHLISENTISMIGQLIVKRGGVSVYSHSEKNKYSSDEKFECFWRNKLKTYTDFLTGIISEVSLGDATLYHTRHFFITEIFNLTGSDIWASAFTHEGMNIAQKHYLHLSKEKADEVLEQYFRFLSPAFGAYSKVMRAILDKTAKRIQKFVKNREIIDIDND